MNRIDNFQGLKKGDKIKIISRNYSRGVLLNRILTLAHNINTDNRFINDQYWFEEKVSCNISINAKDCILIETNGITTLTNVTNLEKMENSLIQLEAEYKEKKTLLEEKIKFCKDNKLDNFDDKLFKVYKAVETIQTGGSTLDQAKAILEVVSMK